MFQISQDSFSRLQFLYFSTSQDCQTFRAASFDQTWESYSRLQSVNIFNNYTVASKMFNLKQFNWASLIKSTKFSQVLKLFTSNIKHLHSKRFWNIPAYTDVGHNTKWIIRIENIESELRASKILTLNLVNELNEWRNWECIPSNFSKASCKFQFQNAVTTAGTFVQLIERNENRKMRTIC